MDVDAGQSCSQGATENSKCVWENRVIGKSRKGNQKQDIPKQTKWHGETWLGGRETEHHGEDLWAGGAGRRGRGIC